MTHTEKSPFRNRESAIVGCLELRPAEIANVGLVVKIVVV